MLSLEQKPDKNDARNLSLKKKDSKVNDIINYEHEKSKDCIQIANKMNG